MCSRGVRAARRDSRCTSSIDHRDQRWPTRHSKLPKNFLSRPWPVSTAADGPVLRSRVHCSSEQWEQEAAEKRGDRPCSELCAPLRPSVPMFFFQRPQVVSSAGFSMHQRRFACVLFATCARTVSARAHALFPFCPRPVHDLFLICSHTAHALFPVVFDLFAAGCGTRSVPTTLRSVSRG